MSTALTVDEVAERLRCDPDHIRHLIACGQLAASDISSSRRRRMWRITPEAIDAFLAARRSSIAAHPSNTDEISARRARAVRTYAR